MRLARDRNLGQRAQSISARFVIQPIGWTFSPPDLKSTGFSGLGFRAVVTLGFAGSRSGAGRRPGGRQPQYFWVSGSMGSSNGCVPE